MPLTLLFSPPPSTSTWIASLDMKNDFHFDLSSPNSYHYIPYALCVEV